MDVQPAYTILEIELRRGIYLVRNMHVLTWASLYFASHKAGRSISTALAGIVTGAKVGVVIFVIHLQKSDF